MFRTGFCRKAEPQEQEHKPQTMTRDYQILQASTPEKLEALVKVYLSKGYHLVGGVSASGKRLYQGVRK